tara:strand:+ start:1061 stop:1801 length:741 start_codon:yes stop_codon:yes gene_type:complete
MAVNVDIVYKTVLLILNQQQRGYMTPDEFNKTATQVQLTIFESYASDLNQQYRLPDNDTEYGDRVKNIEQKLQFFQKYINNAAVPGAITGVNPFTIDLTVVTDLYRLGSVMYQGVQLGQYSQRNEVTQLFLSPLTQPTEKFPIYLYESGQIFVFPNTIITPNDINISYLATPTNVVWDYTTGGLGQYIFDPVGGAGSLSTNFELDISEQTEIILRILAYAGVIIQDPSIVQMASQAVATEDANEKS